MLGPMVIDVAGIELTAEERKRLQHPLVGQVVLFTRNFESPEQLSELSREIRALREPPLLICVDHEGGRVQRFRDGFSPIPAMRTLGDQWDGDAAAAANEAMRLGTIIA